PPRRLAYTWRGGPIDTVLRITLEPVAGGTRMVLEHTGFRGVKALLVSLMMGSGWKGIVRKHIPGVLDRMRDDGTLRPRAEGDHR
ncbi:MAG TPA: SRPBCC domain-containing protein, partial [Candidatus Nitrosotenuis sp.]|nr:SRPBCC domain-containing protein [Candidatus Nitrosotenuis sp.]